MTNKSSKKIQLTDEQKIAYNLIRNGENLFIKGPAGTGKTFVVTLALRNKFDVIFLGPTHQSILVLQTMFNEKSTFLTLDSFFHAIPFVNQSGNRIKYMVPDTWHCDCEQKRTTTKEGLDIINKIISNDKDDKKEKKFENIEEKQRCLCVPGDDRWKYISIENVRMIKKLINKDAIVVDEMSMIPQHYINALEKISEEYGIQLILLGDTNQLTPIETGKISTVSIDQVCELTTIIRTDSKKMQNIYNTLRKKNLPNFDFIEKFLEDSMIVCWKNITVNYHNQKFIDEHKLDHPLHIQEGSRVYFTSNSTSKIITSLIYKVIKISNPITASLEFGNFEGYEITLQSTIEIPNIKTADINVFVPVLYKKMYLQYHKFRESISGNRKFSIIKSIDTKARRYMNEMKLACAVTVHRVQGMTIPIVLIDYYDALEYATSCRKRNKEDDYWRWIYTAATRAKYNMYWYKYKYKY